MGESELKTALQLEGEVQIRDFWQQSEFTVAARRKEVETELLQLRAETDRRLQAEATELHNSLRFASQARVMECRLRAEAELEKRLLLLAHQVLPVLANADRATLWKALRKELPEADWTTLKVHPADQQLATRDFPSAVVESEEVLGGGLIATSADGKIRIDNSLSCRLTRAWPDLLPKLLGELRKRVDNDETAHTNTAV
jgi:vacuolar-type H+-ATPase subunit E/Vma4